MTDTLYESYSTGKDGSDGGQNPYWLAQTFTPSTTHTLTEIKVTVYRVNSPGTVTVRIRATTSDLPSGLDLDSGTFNGDSVTASTDGEEVSVAMTGAVVLSSGTKYAVIISADGASGANEIRWIADKTSAGYTGGNYYESANQGSTWSEFSGHDEYFKEYGLFSETTVTINGATMICSLGTITPTLTQTISGAVSIFSTGALTFFRTLIPGLWIGKTKHTTTFTPKTKHTSTFTGKSKNTSSWTNKTKH
jgi:hypothetical protein